MSKIPNSVIRQPEGRARAAEVGRAGPAAPPATIEILLPASPKRLNAPAGSAHLKSWTVSEAPPDTPWEQRPGRTLKPRRKRRISVRKPGQPGTKRLVAQYGDRLVCVRYIYDEEQEKRFKTAELLLEEGPWTPERARILPEQLVGLRVGYDEVDLRQAVKQAGGRWDRVLQVWVLPYALAKKLRLHGRVTHAAPRQATSTENNRPKPQAAKPIDLEPPPKRSK